MAVETIVLRAHIISLGPMGIKKATNPELAAQSLNRMLEAVGTGIRTQVNVEFLELKWDPFADKFYLDFATGKTSDIVTLRETAGLAEGGFIVSVDIT